MDGVYDLWDVECGNMIDTFASKADALVLVRDLVASYGLDYANGLDLGMITHNGRSRSIASGAALIELAHSTDAALQSANPGPNAA